MVSFSCVLIAVLSVAGGQDQGLEIANLQGTYGHLGPIRPKGDGILPGDAAHLRFDVRNLKADASGRVSYSVAIQVFDDKGKVIFEQRPHNQTAQVCLGGNSVPGSAHTEIPLIAEPGSYAWKLTIVDRTTKQKTSVDGKGKIRPADFGIVQVGTFADREGIDVLAPVSVVGGNLWINFAAVGFERDKKTGQPDVEVSLKVLDAKSTAATPQPLTGRVTQGVPETLKLIPLQFGLNLNRAGRFMVELSARDRLSGKTAMITFPVRVLEPE